MYIYIYRERERAWWRCPWATGALPITGLGIYPGKIKMLSEVIVIIASSMLIISSSSSSSGSSSSILNRKLIRYRLPV